LRLTNNRSVDNNKLVFKVVIISKIVTLLSTKPEIFKLVVLLFIGLIMLCYIIFTGKLNY